MSDAPPTVLLIDNYDSFVYNLARYIEELGATACVVRNDAIDCAGVRAMNPAAIILSPGPCTPNESGVSLQLVKELRGEIPLLGVCLGHQALGQALGGKVVRAPEPVHGRWSLIQHHGTGLFAGLPQPLRVMRYHSLVIAPESLPPELEVTARTDDGLIMAVQHRVWPWYGVQFHPESILTQAGHFLLANFLRLSQISAEVPSCQELQAEWISEPEESGEWPDTAIHW